MNNLYDVLEICLQDLENGMELEKVLSRYPDLANELRPILQASVSAKQMAVPEPSSDMVRRNRAKLLQHAAQMREGQPVIKNSWFASLQRLAVALVLLMLFFMSGTSLVRASSSALPGDSLYAVKRSWERATLFFVSNERAHEALASAYENERLDEINALFASGRSVAVEFDGIITRQNGTEWQIANILVAVSPQTQLSNQTLMPGMAVRVIGTTNGAGVVLAERIEVLPAGAPLPAVEGKQPEIEMETPQATPKPDNTGAGSGSATEASTIKATTTPSPTSTPKIESFEGILNVIDKDIWTVNDILMNVTNAEITGIPVSGAGVKAEGYYGLDGSFIAVKIEIINNGSGNDNGNLNTNNNGGSPNVNDNSSGGNTNTNSNTNDDGNSGSGGGNGSNDNGGGGNSNDNSGGNGSNDNGGGGNSNDNSGGKGGNDNGGGGNDNGN